jgi:hypothetical protein
MIIEWKNYRLRLHCSVRKYVEVEGVNSLLPSGEHILMWDFDNLPLPDVYESLIKIQSGWDLPSIYIVESSFEHYHAYCLDSFPYPQVLNILASTIGLDTVYFKFGILRGYWTLRITPEKGNFKLVQILYSNHHSKNIIDITNLETVKYRTEV